MYGLPSLSLSSRRAILSTNKSAENPYSFLFLFLIIIDNSILFAPVS